MDLTLLTPVFFTIALLYAAAGFGGGSSYLAVLSVVGAPVASLRPLALVCNLLVTGQAAFRSGWAGVMPWRRALPLVAVSMPAAFLGGRVQLPHETYLLTLGCLLVLAGMAMLGLGNGRHRGGADAGAVSVAMGGVVGFVSGVVGIGGGIFLSPLLFLSGWAGARAIAATTSLFIALNSLAGLAGQWTVGTEVATGHLLPLGAAVLAGGWLGTRLTLRWLDPIWIRRIAAVLILSVGARLIWQNMPYVL
jgi:uncharacterized membrane protein YfcA